MPTSALSGDRPRPRCQTPGMRRAWSFEQSSRLPAPPPRVWERVVTPEGINDEMRPWLTMSMPGGRTLTVDTVTLGVPVGRAWLRHFVGPG